MGTRADFYIGRTDQAEWLGSIAWDGYPSGIDHNGFAIFRARTETAFRTAVAAMLDEREDGTTPDLGWPWPWENSGTTDYAYAFDIDAVYGSCFGEPWFRVNADDPDDEQATTGQAPTFPDMSARKNVTYGRRSGVITVSFPTGGES